MSVNSVALILVVKNEELCLRKTLPTIPLAIFAEVFAVDGQSSDGTRQRLEDAKIKTYVQKRPGLGAAMLEARSLVKSDAFIFFHPDGNDSPEDLPRMAAMLKAGSEFVVASRMIQGAKNEEDDKILKFRKWANQGFAIMANILFSHGGNRTSDVTNGFRGITCAAFDKMKLSSFDLTMDFQMIIRALKLGIPITEFPTYEGKRVDGQTNFPSIPTGIAELKLLAREIKMGRRNV